MHLFVRTYVFPLIFAPALWGQTRLSLADALSQALAGNPRLATAAARVRAAEGLQKQAGLSPNPRLIMQLENTRFWGTPAFSYPHDTATYSFLAQTIETGGKRSRRVDLASENIRTSELDVELERRQIVSRVSTAYWAAVGAVRIRNLLQAEVASLEGLVQFDRDRVREGAAPEVELLRIEVERDRLAGLAGTAAQEAERSRIVLFREMGKPEFPQVEFADALEQVRPVALLMPGEFLERRVEMTLARQAVEQARANLRLQQAGAKPDPDLHFGYERIAGFDTIYAAAQIPLPIRNRNQGQIEAAQAEIRAAEAAVASTAAAIRSEVETARGDYESRQRLLTGTLKPMRDRTDEVYRIVDAAYRETGSDILRLLDAARIKTDTEVMYARALAEFQQSIVALETAQGNSP